MSRHMILRTLLPCLMLALLAWPPSAQAAIRAWLDRDTIAADGEVRLSIQTDEGGVPDYAPLRAQFDIESPSNSRQVQWSNGAMRASSTFVVTLVPRRTGQLEIPALQVGAARTSPLRLQVAAAAGSGGQSGGAQGSGAGGGQDNAAVPGEAVAFIELEVDDAQPYVQQSVGVVVRLYFASQLASGSLELDTPQGASLQRMGEDRSSVREVRGRRYNVVERRYLLIPERSGTMQLGAARFDGRAAGGFFDDVFGGGGGRMRATSPQRALQVQAQPADAAQPWLPLQDLQLRYLATPQGLRAGQSAALVVQATARGATRAQMPELPVPDVGNDGQVFAEPVQFEERFENGSALVTMTRRYQVVPRAAGALVVRGLQMDWWDVKAGASRQARLPDLNLQVGQGAFPAPAPASQAPSPEVVDTADAVPAHDVADADQIGGADGSPAPATRPWPWIVACTVLALLWLATTLAWWRARQGARSVAGAGRDAPARRRPIGHDRAALRDALAQGSIEEIFDLLADEAGVQGQTAVLERLADPGQVHALQRMLQARWGGQGDVAAARDALRRAFHDRPHWREEPAATSTDGLPPLYPGR